MTTSSGPRLDLPQRPAIPTRRSGPGALVYLVLTVIVALQLTMMLRFPESGATPASGAAIGGDPEAHKALAMKLEDRNLPSAAARAWTTYLETARPDDRERAAVLYRIGKLHQEAGAHEPAIADFYEAEALLGDESSDLQRQIGLRVRESLRKLGRYAELAREMAQRAALDDDHAPMTGQQAVAQIGEETITVADFDRLLTDQVELAVGAQLGLSAEESDALRRQMFDRFAEPQARSQLLQQIVLQRVLADEARRQKLDDDPAFRRRLVASADDILASTLMFREISARATVTEQDAERFFAAHQDRYSEPGSASIAHVRCATEEDAQIVLARASGGASFDELAAQYSTDETTKDQGGVVDHPVPSPGDQVPGLGRSPALHRAIMDAETGTVLPDPYKVNGAWEVVKVLSRDEPQPHDFAEVRDRVLADVRAARRQEVTQQYVEELFRLHGVKLYPHAFVTGAEHNERPPAATPSGDRTPKDDEAQTP